MIPGHEDTYFFSAQEAQKVALEHNRSEDGESLQVCYYDGEELETSLVNLIHLPIDNLLQDLASGNYRLPEVVNLEGFELSAHVKMEITANFNMSLLEVQEYRKQYNASYLQELNKAKLDFDEPLRFYILANAMTEVMQHVAKSIADALESLGYEVLFDLYYGIEDINSTKKISKFNPHATVNINHFNSSHLNEKCFNFIWYQDPMPILFDNTVLDVRDRDFIYSLLEEIDIPLEKKGISPVRQNFCTNEREFKLLPNISREKKIVFIGSSYHKIIEVSENNLLALDYVSDVFNKGQRLDASLAKVISDKFSIEEDYVLRKLFPYFVRDKTVLWLCSLDIGYQIEIYGNDWDIYEEVRPYYKGVLEYGKEIVEVYNSATYSFAPHNSYILQQRIFEASACGCISIVYECEEPIYEEALEYFKTKEELYQIFNHKPENKSFEKILFENSYKTFANKMIEQIGKKL